MNRIAQGVALLALMAAASPAVASPPNVVMIIADDQGWGDYSFMGHPHIRTPNLDRLATSSLVFRRGYVPTSLCRPSLATMITGLYPHQHKITSNDPPLPRNKTLRAAYDDPDFLVIRDAMLKHIDEVPTLPKYLGEKGYVSFQSGKWWEGHHCRCGFTDGMTHGDPKRGGRHGDEGLKIGRQGLKEVLDFIDAAAAEDKPFYVWYAPMMPHNPHSPPALLLDRYMDKAPSVHVARYWAMCEWFDQTCGQLIDHLDDKALAEDTLVIYLSDNGWVQDPASPRYAPRSKATAHEGGVRTPILLRWPGKVEPRDSDNLASSIDLAPTILAAAGLKPSPEMPGEDLLDSSAVANRNAVFGAIFTTAAVDVQDPASSLVSRWVIEGSWKLIRPARAELRLFDLSQDPGEEDNLAAKHPDKLEHLKKVLDDWWPAKTR